MSWIIVVSFNDNTFLNIGENNGILLVRNLVKRNYFGSTKNHLKSSEIVIFLMGLVIKTLVQL